MSGDTVAVALMLLIMSLALAALAYGMWTDEKARRKIRAHLARQLEYADSLDDVTASFLAERISYEEYRRQRDALIEERRGNEEK